MNGQSERVKVNIQPSGSIMNVNGPIEKVDNQKISDVALNFQLYHYSSEIRLDYLVQQFLYGLKT